MINLSLIIQYHSSYRKNIVYPFTYLQSAVSACHFSLALTLPTLEQAFKNITIVVSISSLAMKIVFSKLSLINILISKFKYANSMFHATTPISLILSPRQEVVSPIPINLVINKTSTIFLPTLIQILPPSILDSLLHLTLIHISIAIPYPEFVVSQLLSLYLLKLVLPLL